jgi:cell wall-associated NlpC family hydrolase
MSPRGPLFACLSVAWTLVTAGCVDDPSSLAPGPVAPAAFLAASPTILPPPVAGLDAHAYAPARERVLAYAAAQVGRPYCWGGTGPSCFDCSGLAMMAWRQAGVWLPRSADDVPRKLTPVALTSAQPGDVLWWPGHVGIYAGNGWSYEALDRKSGVVLRKTPKPRGVYRPAALL